MEKRNAHKAVDAHKSSPATEPLVAKTRTSQSSIAFDAIDALRGVADSLHLGERLTKQQRRTLVAKSALVPTTLIEAVATSASVHRGTVAGMPFDSNAARDVIARAAASKGIIAWTEEIAQRLADDVLRERAAIAVQARQRYMMLSKLVQTPEGAEMIGEYEQMHALMKEAKRPRAKANVTKTPTPAASKNASTTTTVEPTTT